MLSKIISKTFYPIIDKNALEIKPVLDNFCEKGRLKWTSKLETNILGLHTLTYEVSGQDEVVIALKNLLITGKADGSA